MTNQNSNESAETKELYEKYLQLAEQARKEAARRSRRYIVWLAIPGALYLLTVVVGIAGSGFKAASSLGFCGTVALFLLVIPLSRQTRKQREIAGTVFAQGNPGFEEFFRLYLRGYWPKRFPLKGKKSERFASLIDKAGLIH